MGHDTKATGRPEGDTLGRTAPPVTRNTGLELLTEAADLLEAAASACDNPDDAAHFSELVDRLYAYLASSRPTTPLGMPRIFSAPSRLAEEMVVHRTSPSQSSHIRIVPGASAEDGTEVVTE